MKNATIASNKVNKSNKVNNANKEINKALNTKPKVKRDVYASDYGQQVLTVNKQLKTYSKTFKGAVSMLFLLRGDKEAGLKLTKKQARIIMAVAKGKNNKKAYNELEKLTKASKAGNYSPFAILQKIYKHQNELLELI